jgi:hypothetical protein
MVKITKVEGGGWKEGKEGERERERERERELCIYKSLNFTSHTVRSRES